MSLHSLPTRPAHPLPANGQLSSASQAGNFSYINAGIGTPSDASEALWEVIRHYPLEELPRYADTRKPFALDARKVFEAIDGQPHDIPDGLKVIPTMGVRAAFDVFLRGVEGAVHTFNEKTFALYKEQRAQSDKVWPWEPLKAAVIFPVRGFGELTQNIKYNHFALVKHALKEKDRWKITARGLTKTANEAESDPATIIAVYHHNSSHNPSSVSYTYEDIRNLYPAISRINQRRLKKLVALAGGTKNFNRLMKDADFAATLGVLGHVNIFEDAIYLQPKRQGATEHTASFHELYSLFPGINDHVFFAHSPSKRAGSAGLRAGIAIMGKKLAEFMRPYTTLASIGLNDPAYKALPACYDPDHAAHPAIRDYARAREERLKANRDLVARLVNGTPAGSTTNGKHPETILDPFTQKPWSENGIPGMRILPNGDFGMFLEIEFTAREKWKSRLKHYAPKTPQGTPLGMALNDMFRQHLNFELTAEDCTLSPEEGFVRINCDKDPKALIELLSRLLNIDTHLPLLNGCLKAEKTPLKALER
jgi:hypothetical protein